MPAFVDPGSLESGSLESGFLEVNQSITGKTWVRRTGSGPDGAPGGSTGGEAAAERIARAIAQRHDLPDNVARLIAARGIPLDAVAEFLAPSLRTSLPDPDALKGMEAGVARLTAAIRGGETIGIFADYDVDGATSAALLARFLAAVGAPTAIHIPDRIREGYGPNIAALEGLKRRGAGLVVTLDCGVLAFDALKAAAAQSLDIVVVDHHIAEPSLPPAIAIINPNRVDEDGSLGHLAAVGVTFLLVIALNRALRKAGWYEGGRAEPDLLDWLDLVALGTVCDVVPLTGLNRVLVAQGLKVIAGRRNMGLRALSESARLEARPDAWHLGFVLGPRINAAGRVGQADLGTRLLMSEDEGEARKIAAMLEANNLDRKDVEAKVLAEAVRMAGEAPADQPVLVVAGAGWHPGVIGIAAARLRERFNRPACVIALGAEAGAEASGKAGAEAETEVGAEAGGKAGADSGAEAGGQIGKGSGRSVPGFALGAAVVAACQAGVLIGGGGHAMAAGFTIAKDQIDPFRRFLADRFAAELAGGELRAELTIDAMLTPGGATRELIEALSQIAPFGSGNPEPRFVIAGAQILRADVVGETHLRCILGDADGGRLKSIAFRAMDGPLGPALLNHGGRRAHLAGHLRADDWQGRANVQLIIDDASFV